MSQRLGVQPCKLLACRGVRCAIGCYTRVRRLLRTGPGMHSELSVLIVNPLLGTAGLMELAGRLRAAVEVAEFEMSAAAFRVCILLASQRVFGVILGSGSG